jgi:hypothetical protein
VKAWKAMVLVAALSASPAVAAERLLEVPCEQLHVRISGDDYLPTCRAAEFQESDGRWRAEVVTANNTSGAYLLERAVALSARAHLHDRSPRSIAEGFGFEGIQEWSREMHIAGYRVHTYTGRTRGGTEPLRCMAYAKSTSRPRAGFGERVNGVYCTSLLNPLDEATAAQILGRIELQ